MGENPQSDPLSSEALTGGVERVALADLVGQDSFSKYSFADMPTGTPVTPMGGGDAGGLRALA